MLAVASLFSGTATGNRGLNVNGTASTTILTGGSAAAASTAMLSASRASIATATSGGLVITDGSNAVLTGGSATAGTNMTLSNSGVNLAQTVTGAPVRVSGVANAINPNDAVNYSQYKSLETLMSRGIASSTAIANIPNVEADATFSAGVGLGHFNGYTAIAFGASYRFAPNAQLKASIGTGTSGGGKANFGIGAGWSW